MILGPTVVAHAHAPPGRNRSANNFRSIEVPSLVRHDYSQDLTKRYARNIAVDHISFSVNKGDIVGFLGPNGAGKTTTMRMLTCFLPPTAGMPRGRLRRLRPVHRGQEAHWLSAGNAAALPRNGNHRVPAFVGRLKACSGADLEKRVDDVCERCAIADVSKPLGKLSKGYRQRVGLAQAIIHNPDVLILDEPTAGLDPKQIIETRDLIKRLAGDHTIILSTHILPEVEQTCERVIIISKGKLVATDSSRTCRPARAARIRPIEIAPAPLPCRSPSSSALEQVAGVSRVSSKDGPTAARFRSRGPRKHIGSRRFCPRDRRIRLESV